MARLKMPYDAFAIWIWKISQSVVRQFVSKVQTTPIELNVGFTKPCDKKVRSPAS